MCVVCFFYYGENNNNILREINSLLERQFKIDTESGYLFTLKHGFGG